MSRGFANNLPRILNNRYTSQATRSALRLSLPLDSHLRCLLSSATSTRPCPAPTSPARIMQTPWPPPLDQPRHSLGPTVKTPTPVGRSGCSSFPLASSSASCPLSSVPSSPVIDARTRRRWLPIAPPTVPRMPTQDQPMGQIRRV